MDDTQSAGDLLRMLTQAQWVQKFRFAARVAVHPVKTDAPLLVPDVPVTMEYRYGLSRGTEGHPLADRVLIQEDPAGQWALLTDIDSRQVIFYAFSHSREKTEEILKLVSTGIQAPLPPPPADNPRRVFATLSYLDRHGSPAEFERLLTVPTWADIRENYASGVQAEMDKVMALTRDELDGKIILLHGTPGSGKTHLIRALASEWRKWAKMQYAIDAEVLLNDPVYLLTSIMNVRGSGGKIPLIVMEDCGELIGTDAKERSGQGLARLLNAADGILGQALNVVFVITTNEKHNGLHAAVSRPGRALSVLEVPALAVPDAAAWLKKNGVTEEAPVKEMTLAELYHAAKLAGVKVKDPGAAEIAQVAAEQAAVADMFDELVRN